MLVNTIKFPEKSSVFDPNKLIYKKLSISFSTDVNRNPSGLKILDFQLPIYDSAIHDLLFFILTSIDDPNLEENFDTYIDAYYKSFSETLEELDVPLSKFK